MKWRLFDLDQETLQFGSKERGMSTKDAHKLAKAAYDVIKSAHAELPDLPKIGTLLCDADRVANSLLFRG